MVYDPNKVLQMMEKFVAEIQLGKAVHSVHYREDYLDYMIVFEGGFHCELREKLIDTLFKERNPDLVREVTYLMKKAPKFEDWEDNPADMQTPSDDEGSGPKVDLTGL